MIYKIYDHYHPEWNQRMKRPNGAFTYSKELVKYWVQEFEAENLDAMSRNVISTCPLLIKETLRDLPKNIKMGTLVQVLHSYPLAGELEQIHSTVKRFGENFEKILFISAYVEYAKKINAFYKSTPTVEAIFKPMVVSTLAWEYGQENRDELNTVKNSIVWFGNVYREKVETHRKVERICEKLGIHLVTISDGIMRSKRGAKKVTQEEAWKVCMRSGKVLAVGRCYLEASLLGCEVMVCGNRFGGYVTSEAEHLIQHGTNYNGRLTTSTGDLEKSIRELVRGELTGKLFAPDPLEITH